MSKERLNRHRCERRQPICSASVSALILIDLISIIALFNARLNVAVTAARRLAVGAGVGGVLVAVIAAFKAVITIWDVCPHDAVAATRREAGV